MAWRRLCVLACVCLAHSAVGAESDNRSIAIIVSARWDTPTEIEVATLRRLYLGRVTQWAGQRVERFHLPPGSEARAAFARQVIGRSERELDDYWLQQALTGGAVPPREVESVGSMLDAIDQSRGAIGYLPLSALASEKRERVRILAVRTPGGTHLPDDTGYPIQMASRSPAASRTP